MKNKIDFKIYSIDGKVYEDEIDAIYLDVPDAGVIGVLPSRTPYAALLNLATFYIVKNGVKIHFAISGGSINFKDGEAIVLALTYEKEDELNRERIEKARDEALKELSTIDKKDELAYEKVTFNLKKAFNRLKLLK